MGAYKLSKDAFKKLENIYEYSILNFGEHKADEYYLSLHTAFKLLAEQPSLGRKFYEFHRHEHNHYVFFYTVTDYGILILHISHQTEDVINQIRNLREKIKIGKMD